ALAPATRDQILIDSDRFPDIADLAARLRFSPEEGRIWLDQQRMLLIHSGTMGLLRRELIEQLGPDRVRQLFTRMGYDAGARDANMARKVRPDGNIADIFSVGPQLHCLQGIVLVEPVRMEM